MKRLLATAIPIVACGALLGFFYYLHMRDFSLGSGFVARSAVLAMLGVTPFLLLIVWAKRPLWRWIGIVGLGGVIALQIFALSVQYFAKQHIAQNVPVGFIIDNWPAIRPFVTAWQAYLLPLLIVIFGFVVALSIRTVMQKLYRPLASLLVVVALIGSVALAAAAGRYDLFHNDPVLGLFGYSSDVLQTDQVITLVEEEKILRTRYKPSAHRPKRDVVIFMADSINPLHLAQFGYERDTLPFLDQVADDFDAINLAKASSTCTDSVCGVLSTLSGRYFRDTPPYGAFGLGQVLRAHGYRVNYILSADHRRFQYAHYWRFLEQEADLLYDYTMSDHPINSDKVILDGIESLPISDDRPTFTFVFFFSSHIAGEQEERFQEFGPFLRRRQVWKLERNFSADDLQEFANHYDNKLRQLNHYMSRAYQGLKAKGYLDDPIFIFLADHGEELGQRGFLGHTAHRFTAGLTDIPFLITSRERISQFSAKNPQQLDVSKTVLDILGLPAPDLWEGWSLLDKPEGMPVFAEFGVKTLLAGKQCFMVRTNEADGRLLKYVACRDPAGSEQRALFDLTADPLETTNILSDAPKEEQKRWEQLLSDHFDVNLSN